MGGALGLALHSFHGEHCGLYAFFFRIFSLTIFAAKSGCNSEDRAAIIG